MLPQSTPLESHATFINGENLILKMVAIFQAKPPKSHLFRQVACNSFRYR